MVLIFPSWEKANFSNKSLKYTKEEFISRD